jgi:hypothetical protein
MLRSGEVLPRRDSGLPGSDRVLFKAKAKIDADQEEMKTN